MKRVSVILGTRPEAIKLCPVILALRDHREFEPHVCATAQHREMLDQVLDVFGVVPDADLDLMRPNQALADLTSRAIETVDGYLAKHQPDLVLAQGDTTTTFCAALAAFYRHIPVGHVEAGLRTWNKFSPYPEEINRVLATRLADLHFAPTDLAKQNLLKEGVPGERVLVTGNTVVDALMFAVQRVRRHRPSIPGLPKELMNGECDRPVVLITAHRRENFGRRLESICRAIAGLGEVFPDAHFVYPVHLNPNVREPVFRRLAGRKNIHLIEPLSYLPFVAMMDRSTLILTDSGGVQEEAPSLGKPVFVMRDTTERPEAVEAGTAKLVGTDSGILVREVTQLLNSRRAYGAMAHAHNPYGDGRAAGRILDACERFLSGAETVCEH